MNRQTSLAVKPVRRYPAPSYPAWDDPDPVALLDTRYPFRRSALAVAAALGLAGVLHADEEVDDLARDKLTNPFTVATSGLPRQPLMFGTGAPSHLDDEVARKLIEKVFKEEGFELKRDVAYKRGDIEFVASGYNADKKIGYVWGSWDKLGADTLTRTRIPAKDQPINAQWLGGFLGPDYKARYKKAVAVKDPEKRQKAFRELLDEQLAEDARREVSLEEMRTVNARAEQGKEFVAIISMYDRRFEYSMWEPIEDPEERRRIERIEDPQKKAEAYKQNYEKRARQALDRLEGAVRRYIKWARTQGL